MFYQIFWMFLCDILKDMKQKCKKVFITTLFILGFVLLPCFADDGHGYIDPYLGGFVIEQSDSIEMTEEIVEIWEDHVKVTFWFTNLEDTPQDVTIGFPVESFRNEKEKKSRWDDGLPLLDNEEDRKQIEDFYQFTSTCNGQELPRTLVANAHKVTDKYDDELFDFWFTSELHFEANEVLEVVDEYHVHPNYWNNSTGWWAETYNYVLTTGSSWANVIKKATILFHTRPEAWLGGAYEVPEKSTRHDGTTINFKAPVDCWIVSWGVPMVYVLDELQQYRCACSYEPTRIEYNPETSEVTVIWILEDIKPVDDWIVYYEGIGRADGGFLIPFTLMRSELEKIPDFTRLDYYFEDMWSDDVIQQRIAETTREDMSQMIADVYKRAFTHSPKVTQQASIISQFLINSIYALHGYQFQNAKWTDIFSQFSWYKPSAGFSEASFTAEEQAMIKRLQEFR